MKKRLYVLLVIFMSIVGFWALVYEPILIMRVDNVIKDAFKRIHVASKPPKKGDERVVIVDIDEKSLAALGQWPWDRDLLACLQERLSAAAVVGYDIFFAEADRRSQLTSGLSDEDFSKLNLPPLYGCKRSKDPDAAFAKALASSSSVLAYAVNLGNYKALKERALAPLSNQSVQEANIAHEFLAAGKNITASIEKLSENAYANGFVNSYAVLDGIIRNAYMLIFYDDGEFAQTLPSLSLAMYAKYLGSDDINAIGDEAGFIHLKIADAPLINLNDHGLLALNFEGSSRHYHYISAVDVLSGAVAPEFFDGKLVLVGTSSVGLNDIRATPLDENLPGVEVHAYALDNLLNNSYAQPAAGYALFELLSAVVLILLAACVNYFLPLFISLIASGALLAGISGGLYYLTADLLMQLRVFAPLLVFALTALGGFLINFILENRAKELIKNKLERKVSKQVAKELINTKGDVFASSRREISVFFSDVRDFTTISETLSTEELINLLNAYMTPMSRIIEARGGTVDKYIGDAVMAYFNAPNTVENHADAALMAAIEQIRALRELNREWQERGLPYVNIGIGINTDECIVGEMGSLERSDYTCIGDGVNTASRVESSCKNYRANILISQNTYEKLADPSIYELELVDELTLKGKLTTTKLFKCYGLAGEGLDLWPEHEAAKAAGKGVPSDNRPK